MDNAIITVENVSFSRGDKCVLDNVSFTIPKNRITAILGPSGTGKTTILKLICGQLEPDAGNITIMGNRLGDMSKKALFAMRKNIGVLFQSGALLNNLTVYDNIAFPLREHTKISEAAIKYLVLTKLKAVGLEGVSQLYPRELSGGMIRRAALARAIALDPQMVFYDEPFAGQDPILMGVLLELINKLNQAFQLTSIVITHDIEEIFKIADYVIMLNEAKVVATGSPSDIQQNSHPFIQQFLRQGTSVDASEATTQRSDEYEESLFTTKH